MQKPYDQTSPDSILSFGKKLLGKTLESQPGIVPIPNEMLETSIGKRSRGTFGGMLEKYYFGINPGNESAPDFKEAGVELKSTPIKLTKNGISAKERLVLNLIDFEKEALVKRFEDSNLYKKNNAILLISYEHLPWRAATRHPVRVVHMLRYKDLPIEDQRVIRNDWEKIVSKIRAGKANELSEGDTDYLGACTKAADSSIRRRQANGGAPAKPRAYSLKAGYMTVTLRKLIGAVDSNSQSLKSRAHFEDTVLNRLNAYAGKKVSEILAATEDRVNLEAKGALAALTQKMLGVSKKRIEEFEKAGIEVKTIRILPSGTPKESMSFPAMKFDEVLQEEWDADIESSQRCRIQDYSEKRFLFVVFDIESRNTRNEQAIFRKAFFWNMPYEDREAVRRTWNQTRKAIMESKPSAFPAESGTRVAHVRPHGRNKQDISMLPDGTMTPKRSFWLNKSYIKKVVSEHL